MSISMLIVSISMLALFVCSSVASAQTPSKFIYDKGANAETVYTLDETGKFLTPKLKYEFSKESDNKVVKLVSSWNNETQAWAPYYKLTRVENETNAVLEYAAWDCKTRDYTNNLEKVIYNKDFNNEPLSYVSYKWSREVGNWVVSQHLLLEEYLAMDTNRLN